MGVQTAMFARDELRCHVVVCQPEPAVLRTVLGHSKCKPCRGFADEQQRAGSGPKPCVQASASRSVHVWQCWLCCKRAGVAEWRAYRAAGRWALVVWQMFWQTSSSLSLEAAAQPWQGRMFRRS